MVVERVVRKVLSQNVVRKASSEYLHVFEIHVAQRFRHVPALDIPDIYLVVKCQLPLGTTLFVFCLLNLLGLLDSCLMSVQDLLVRLDGCLSWLGMSL